MYANQVVEEQKHEYTHATATAAAQVDGCKRDLSRLGIGLRTWQKPDDITGMAPHATCAIFTPTTVNDA